MHKTTLFLARTGGYWNYRVPGILTTPRGVVLATAEARRGRGGDWDGNDVLLRRSPDGGVTWEPPRVVVACEAYGPGPVSNFVWSTPRFDDALLEPVCMASLLRLSKRTGTGEPVYLFCNPDNLENELIPAGGNLAHDRKRLAVKASLDGCRTWPWSRVIEPGPAGYSDLAEAPDGAILCIYECGMIERMTDTRSLTVARFDLEWVMGADGRSI